MTGEAGLDLLPPLPDTAVAIPAAFGIDLDGTAPAFALRTAHVPPVDPAYRFDPATTMAILAGFRGSRRVPVQGRHGTGKSSHVEQVAARLNWPCIRVKAERPIFAEYFQRCFGAELTAGAPAGWRRGAGEPA